MPPSPLRRYLSVQDQFDREIAAILREAAKEAERLAVRLGEAGIGRGVRSGQYRLAAHALRQEQARLWGHVTDATARGMRVSAAAAVEASLYVEEAMFQITGGVIPELMESLRRQGFSGVESLISRKELGISLSERVYSAKSLSNGQLFKQIDHSLALGESAKELAKRVRGFIDPNTPGGASYAAMRLGRTEINNAFHHTQRKHHEDSPWVTSQKWNLSGSHPKPDECNAYADDDHAELGAGIFLKNEVPGKPHPNCLCYITPVALDEEEFVQGFLDGKFDAHIDRKISTYSPEFGIC